MENTEEHIEKFIKHVKKRLNKHFGLTVLIGSLAASGVIMTVIALTYIIRGYHVPLFWYPLCFISSLFLGGCFWLYFRKSHDQAAIFTDEYFSLKDTVRSYSGFHKAHKNSGFYKLQAIQTENYISSIKIDKIKYKCPLAVLVIGIILIFTSGLMGFKDDSPIVRQRIEQEKLMLESTQLINQQINELMEQMQEELEEKDLDKIVDMNEVRQKAEELQETPDIKEAMRQYAQLERELGEVLSKLTQRQDEQLLERMGKQLQKDDETKALGNQLTQKEYKNASNEMEKFEIDPDAKMEIQKEQIEKLKEMAARMAQEIEKNEAVSSQSSTSSESSQGQKQNSQQANQNQQSNQNQQGNSQKNQQSQSSRLAQMTQKLNQSAQALSQAMQQAMSNQPQNGQNQNGQSQSGQSQNNQSQNGQPQNGQPQNNQNQNGQSQNGQSQNNQNSSGQMQQMMQNTNQNLGNMGQFLQQLDAKRQAQSMMQSMLNSLAQSQAGLGQMPGNGQMPGSGNMPGQNGQGQNGQEGQNGQNGGGIGGNEAGTGSSLIKNTDQGKDAPAGEATRLQGVHNNGTSTSALEESGSGSGSSLGMLELNPEEYMRQVESFIRREDVPESVKAGVKAYFENIHKINEEN